MFLPGRLPLTSRLGRLLLLVRPFGFPALVRSIDISDQSDLNIVIRVNRERHGICAMHKFAHIKPVEHNRN